MSRRWWPAGSIFVLGASACAPEERTGPADVVFRRAAVYTVDAARSWASAVGIRDGRIVYVGERCFRHPSDGASWGPCLSLVPVFYPISVLDLKIIAWEPEPH